MMSGKLQIKLKAKTADDKVSKDDSKQDVYDDKQTTTTTSTSTTSTSTSTTSTSTTTESVSEVSRGRSRTKEQIEIIQETPSDDMFHLMGFTNFKSTKNKKVIGTDCYGVNKKQKTTYRQYMNREKGFNRPLSPPRKPKKN
ncbi:hypothetical protein CANARDRAFT_26516 [[Candida] arabinofermentans NRRL YB-2248]|uniref:U4/U6.U5 small nuclear ribonucleoprotein 27kDa protein domain-containing protein n=1 Tax=[Candida] arabinofermentans NRRL YB-2248 TaxID=983967 RepID=A0A1E4T5P7_9ASCO|nr:hypothetical protein CANARDRAFT_26516 [[Candida] arabinofermentans NRRL YB-2248]